MSGETKIEILLRTMQPLLSPEEYVFCSRPSQDFKNLDLNPVGIFREKEGLTLILTKQEADSHKLAYSAIFSMITLEVHSSLEAVGFIAAIASKLAQHNISVNPVSAYYHDHLFIPVACTQDAMNLLQEFSQSF
ncbi:MAG: ACT domain-containing protein [Cyanobacteria bacterium P01_A01_bin.40]